MAVGERIGLGAGEADLKAQRDKMVDRQIARRGIKDERILAAMSEVPREAFVDPQFAEFAYEDTPLPIAAGQTISQPYIVALMIDAAEIQEGDRVLDVGTGSGYAAAVLSRMAERVYSVERHEELANRAREVAYDLNYHNIEIRHADGTLGWPEEAPFDAILVAAGGPEIPQALLNQLSPGGRLIMPLGKHHQHQQLIRVRETAGEFKREDLGAVAFVPLIGEQGWRSPEAREKARSGRAAAAGRAAATGDMQKVEDAKVLIARHAEPLRGLADPQFAIPFDRIADARVVLLGEATHGTSEFYRARAAITQHLIEHHGFNMVAVEADWPDAASIDRYVRQIDGRRPGETLFARFPTWMWRNVEVQNFTDWLQQHNAAVHDPKSRVSFHGLDLYSLNASIRAVLDYLDQVDPEAAAIARERYGCLSPWERDPATYGRAALHRNFMDCENAVVTMLRDILSKHLEYAAKDGDRFIDAAQNARLVAAAEHYYRAIYYGSALSWNLRDKHMFETLVSTMKARGDKTKAVVWAHNSHIGNAAATEMGIVSGEINLGQLCRDRFGREAALVGFGTDRGTVTAASNWDGPMQTMSVRSAVDGSYEALCREADTNTSEYLLDIRPDVHYDLREQLLQPRLERAIGVIYRPQTELASHYFQASLPEQFDLYVWLEETSAVHAIPVEHVEGAPDTYPFGL